MIFSKSIKRAKALIKKDQNKVDESMDIVIELSDIPSVFQRLLSNDGRVKLQCAETINYAVGMLSSSQLVKLDKTFRERGFYEWRYDWTKGHPKELLHPLMSDEEQFTILALSTFHPNGYFREKSVKALSDMQTGNAIPYFLIRMNDWVRQVRESSKEQFKKYLDSQYTVSLINNLPLLFRLEQCERDNYLDVINAVVSILCSAESYKSLIDGLHSTDSKVRLCCYKIILEKRILDNKSIVNYLIKDKNPYNRLFVLRNIMKEITADEFNDTLDLLLNDKLAQIRIIALERIHELNPEESIEVLERSLFDRSSSVREFTRFLLSKHRKYDFTSLYVASIEKNENLYSSICGVGETGSRQYSKNIAGFINSDTIQIVKASINALAKLDFNEYKEKFIMMLDDERFGVSKAAKGVLKKDIISSDIEDIYRIYKNSKFEHVRVNTCVILCSVSKWDAIRYIIEFCADNNQNVAEIGQNALESWKLQYNKTFTVPTKKQITEINQAIIKFGNSIDEANKSFIKFAIRNVTN